MLYVIGLEGCHKCENKKKELDEAGKEYIFILYKDLSREAKSKLSKNFRNADGILNLPIVLENPEEYGII